jgi:hypothetical protein
MSIPPEWAQPVLLDYIIQNKIRISPCDVPSQKSAQRIAFHVLLRAGRDTPRISPKPFSTSRKSSASAACATTSATASYAFAVPTPAATTPSSASWKSRTASSALKPRGHGALSPLRGIATNPTVEGEATAVYLARLLKPLGVKSHRHGYSRRQPFGIRRRSDHFKSHGRAAGNVVASETGLLACLSADPDLPGASRWKVDFAAV